MKERKKKNRKKRKILKLDTPQCLMPKRKNKKCCGEWIDTQSLMRKIKFSHLGAGNVCRHIYTFDIID